MIKLIVYIPDAHLEVVKAALFEAGAGKVGNYDACCWQTKGIGQFRGNEDSQPFLGKPGEIESTSEWKVELILAENTLHAVLTALHASHPYETPAYQYWAVND